MIFDKCIYHSRYGRCYSLVSNCSGLNDRVARDYIRKEECGYFMEGSTDKTIGNINFTNS